MEINVAPPLICVRVLNMLTPEDITKALEICKHCLTDADLRDKVSFELNIEESLLIELKEKIQTYLQP